MNSKKISDYNENHVYNKSIFYFSSFLKLVCSKKKKKTSDDPDTYSRILFLLVLLVLKQQLHILYIYLSQTQQC